MCLTHFSDVEIYGSIQGNCHFPVHFIIKAAPIRGKPSCAATWPQSFASAENADRRQIFKSRTLGLGQLVFVLPVPCLTSSPQRGWRIRQITLLGDMSAAMVAGSRGAVSGGIWKWDNGSSFPSVTLLWEPPEGKRGRLTPSSSITSAFQGGWLAGRPPLTMGTRQKAESSATGAGREPEPRFPARRAGHPGGAPVGGRC